MAGMESKSRRVTEVCSVGVTAAPIQLHPENGSSAGSPGHELRGHQVSEVRGAGKKCFSLTHKEQFVQKNIYIYSRGYVLFDTHGGGSLHGHLSQEELGLWEKELSACVRSRGNLGGSSASAAGPARQPRGVCRGDRGF